MRPRRSILVLLVGMLATTACAGDTTPSEAAAPVAEQSSDEQLSDEQSSDERQADANGGPHVTKRHPSDRTHIRPDRDRTRPTVAAGDASDEIAELTESDTSGLLWMREEEQLAHDVYTALGERWGLRIFENIAASERTHIEFVVALLDRYGVDDSLAGVSTGQFTIPEMQELYDELVAVGRESMIGALEVGALIEELDIVDLRARATDITDIQTTYDLLERGSRNHLRAFTSQLGARGVTHVPTQLDAAASDAIVSGAMERGLPGSGRGGSYHERRGT